MTRRQCRPRPEGLEDRALLSSITEYPIPHGSFQPGVISLAQITSGPDGNLWFTDGEDDAIDRVTPDGTVTQFLTRPQGVHGWVMGISPRPDGTLAFNNALVAGQAAIGTITTSGQISSTPTPTAPGESTPMPQCMTTAPDGSLWWIDYGNNAIGELTASGVFHSFPIPTANATSDDWGFGPGNEITPGPDGNIWFVEGHVSKVGEITPRA